MKIRKFNENFEWLEGETIKLIDLTGPIKSTSRVHPSFRKYEFERGCLKIQYDWESEIKNYLDKEFLIFSSNESFPKLPNPQQMISQDPPIPEKYKFAYLKYDYDYFFIGIFDLKGNLVFLSGTHGNQTLFGDILIEEFKARWHGGPYDETFQICVNLATRQSQIIFNHAGAQSDFDDE